MTSSYRIATAEDRPFIVSGWSASQRGTRDIPLIPMAMWASIWHPVVHAALDRPSVVTVVAHGEVLRGFICAEAQYVLYVYVAQPFRRCGIARGLFASVGIDPASRFSYACRTRASWECRAQFPLAFYDPYRARYEDPSGSRDSGQARGGCEAEH